MSVDLENSTQNKIESRRIQWLDTFRGVAIMLMVVYHFFFDLAYFGWYDANVGGRSGWLPFRYFILASFISLMAASLNRAHLQRVNFRKYGVWLLKVGGAALLVSIGTSFVFPHSWVYFGVLHYMVFASIFVLVFKKYRLLSFFLGFAIVAIHLLDILPYGWPINYIKHFFHSGRSVDFVPATPWLGVALIASSLSHYLFTLDILNSFADWLPQSLAVMGRHSLLIYLMHQPILFGLLSAVKYLMF